MPVNLVLFNFILCLCAFKRLNELEKEIPRDNGKGNVKEYLQMTVYNFKSLAFKLYIKSIHKLVCRLSHFVHTTISFCTTKILSMWNGGYLQRSCRTLKKVGCIKEHRLT